MRANLIHSLVAAALALWALASNPARGADLAQFNAAVEAAWSHQRVALGYLRTGNAELAAMEVERFAESWGAVGEGGRPPEIENRALYVATMTDISTRIILARMMIEVGKPDVARDALAAMRAAMSKLRKDSGITVLADCVLDANEAMDALYVFKEAPDLSRAELAADVLARATRYIDTLRRCDRIAPDKVRADADFRRLVDGALASLAQIPKAVDARDGDLVHRLIIELRSFDNLLAFRFG